jgi:hypothetical protein
MLQTTSSCFLSQLQFHSVAMRTSIPRSVAMARSLADRVCSSPVTISEPQCVMMALGTPSFSHQVNCVRTGEWPMSALPRLRRTNAVPWHHRQCKLARLSAPQHYNRPHKGCSRLAVSKRFSTACRGLLAMPFAIHTVTRPILLRA